MSGTRLQRLRITESARKWTRTVTVHFCASTASPTACLPALRQSEYPGAPGKSGLHAAGNGDWQRLCQMVACRGLHARGERWIGLGTDGSQQRTQWVQNSGPAAKKNPGPAGVRGGLRQDYIVILIAPRTCGRPGWSLPPSCDMRGGVPDLRASGVVTVSHQWWESQGVTLRRAQPVFGFFDLGRRLAFGFGNLNTGLNAASSMMGGSMMSIATAITTSPFANGCHMVDSDSGRWRHWSRARSAHWSLSFRPCS